ncbi:MAG: tRNA pseudouridine(38-40) synthase TruA [Holosporales bacterium]|jgi:tRNA pseudouridine38-40 synthase|nr:tRNA pseudouridine(38-40) synthase TruA [Holosporales bacterium]
MRIKLAIEYAGGGFSGWQKQKTSRSVQETIEEAIEKVFDNKESIVLYGAGRTDTGVHAAGQIAHFDINDEELCKFWSNNMSKLPIAINHYLRGCAVVILSSEIVCQDFHARFSAKIRHYKYLIYNRRAKSVFYENRAWHIIKQLDDVKMNEAAQFLCGTHNLNSFRSASCNAKNPVKTISNITVYRDHEFVIIEISAKSFLHNQVRIIAGTLVQIGNGERGVEYISFLLDSGDRTLAGPTAPPYGLYLSRIEY